MSCLLGCPDQLKDTLAPFMGVRQKLVRREANAMGKRAPGLSCHCDSVASAPGPGWWNRKCVCNRLQALSPLRTRPLLEAPGEGARGRGAPGSGDAAPGADPGAGRAAETAAAAGREALGSRCEPGGPGTRHLPSCRAAGTFPAPPVGAPSHVSAGHPHHVPLVWRGASRASPRGPALQHDPPRGGPGGHSGGGPRPARVPGPRGSHVSVFVRRMCHTFICH